MRRKKDEFAYLNRTKKTGRVVVVTVAVLAICISGILYARKLQMDAKYISMSESETIVI